jgi:hypothetical protein
MMTLLFMILPVFVLVNPLLMDINLTPVFLPYKGTLIPDNVLVVVVVHVCLPNRANMRHVLALTLQTSVASVVPPIPSLAAGMCLAYLMVYNLHSAVSRNYPMPKKVPGPHEPPVPTMAPTPVIAMSVALILPRILIAHPSISRRMCRMLQKMQLRRLFTMPLKHIAHLG